MSLWKTAPQANAIPQWERFAPTPYVKERDRLANVWADNDGWKQLLPGGTGTRTEILVAIQNLDTKMGGANATIAYFQTDPGTFEGNVKSNIVVAFDHQVQVLGGQTPNINLTQAGSLTSNIIAGYVGGNGTNQLIFQFTTPSDWTGNANANSTLTLPQTPIFAGPGNNLIVNSTNTAQTATLTLSNANFLFEFAGTTLSANVSHKTASIINITSDIGTTMLHSTKGNLFVNWSDTIKVWGDIANSANILIHDSNTNTNIKATYVSGNNSTNLKFGFTATAFTTDLLIQTGISINTTLLFADTQNANSSGFIITSSLIPAKINVT